MCQRKMPRAVRKMVKAFDTLKQSAVYRQEKDNNGRHQYEVRNFELSAITSLSSD